MKAASSCSQCSRVDRSDPASSSPSRSSRGRRLRAVPRIIRRSKTRTRMTRGLPAFAPRVCDRGTVRGVTQGRMDRSLSEWLPGGESAAGCGEGSSRREAHHPQVGRAARRRQRAHSFLEERRRRPRGRSMNPSSGSRSAEPSATGCVSWAHDFVRRLQVSFRGIVRSSCGGGS